jgi:hypothetical protein
MILIIFFFFIKDFKQIRLFFHQRIHNRNMLEAYCVWFYFAQRVTL